MRLLLISILLAGCSKVKCPELKDELNIRVGDIVSNGTCMGIVSRVSRYQYIDDNFDVSPLLCDYGSMKRCTKFRLGLEKKDGFERRDAPANLYEILKKYCTFKSK